MLINGPLNNGPLFCNTDETKVLCIIKCTESDGIESLEFPRFKFVDSYNSLNSIAGFFKHAYNAFLRKESDMGGVQNPGILVFPVFF